MCIERIKNELELDELEVKFFPKEKGKGFSSYIPVKIEYEFNGDEQLIKENLEISGIYQGTSQNYSEIFYDEILDIIENDLIDLELNKKEYEKEYEME